jgi:hypothetical protein
LEYFMIICEAAEMQFERGLRALCMLLFLGDCIWGSGG